MKNTAKKIVKTLEFTVSELALPTSILSMAETGGILSRSAGGFENMAMIIYQGVACAFGGKITIMDGYSIAEKMYSLSSNLNDEYLRTIASAAICYCSAKGISYALGYISEKKTGQQLANQAAVPDLTD